MSWGNAFRYLQKNLFDYTLDTKNINTLLAVLEARRDNTDITVGDLVVEAGKARPLKINYFAPICDDDGDCDTNICDTGTSVAPVQDWFEITQCTASAVYQLNKEDIRNVDGNYTFSDNAISVIKAALPTIREKLSTDVATLLVGETGVLPDGNTSMSVPIMDPTTGGMAPQGFWTIQQQYTDSGYISKMPYIIGGTQVFNWQKASDIAGMQTNAGLDFGKLRPVGNLYYDKLIGQIYGDTTSESIIAFSPDMLKFVSYSKNAGIFATDVNNVTAIDAMYQRGYPTLVNGGFVDPRTGLLWDLDIIFEPCGPDNQPIWKFQLRLNWDIFFMPPRICNIQGLNSIFHFTTCLPQQPACGDNPYPSAASATLRTADASGLSYPLIIQSLQIGNIVTVNIPNEPISLANIGELVALLNESQGNITFDASGNNLRYTGYSDIDVIINGTTTLSFS